MSNSTTITVDGTSYSVQTGMTVIQAMLHSGRPMTRGVGCLGGTCGACPINVRLPRQFDNHTSLACQTLVCEGMVLSFLPPDSSKKEIASLPTEGPIERALVQHYPETRRCVVCRACNLVCPQGIDAMGGVRAAINGDLQTVADKFLTCVMCGLCAAVCDSGVRPHRMGMYARRLVGAFQENQPTQLLNRIQEIESGVYQNEWENLMQSPSSLSEGNNVNEHA